MGGGGGNAGVSPNWETLEPRRALAASQAVSSSSTQELIRLTLRSRAKTGAMLELAKRWGKRSAALLEIIVLLFLVRRESRINPFAVEFLFPLLFDSWEG